MIPSLFLKLYRSASLSIQCPSSFFTCWYTPSGFIVWLVRIYCLQLIVTHNQQMEADKKEIAINQYLDAVLDFEPARARGEEPTPPCSLVDETYGIFKHDHQAEGTLNESRQSPEGSLIHRDSHSSSRENTKPKDYLKNMYNNSLKFIVKRYISQKYQKRVGKIHQQLKIEDPYCAKLYYKQRQEQIIGLTNLRNLLNYNRGTPKERLYKKAFNVFYVWFMRRQYPIHILKTGKLQHAQVYWRAKNILIYLPALKYDLVRIPTTSQTPSLPKMAQPIGVTGQSGK